jgi:hypothetical protein
MGRTCSTYGGEESWKNLRGEDHLEDPSVDRRVILKWILEMWYGGMDWINLAQDKNRWQALVNAVLNFEFLE